MNCCSKVHSDLSDPTVMSVLLSSDRRDLQRPWCPLCGEAVGTVLDTSGHWPLQVCTCYPTDRQAFCSDHLPEGVHVLTTMDITRKTDQGSE
ncbi:hypothetical protein ACOMHN_055380 [Nucella lapillus]